ncbi:Hypothetical predicted protein [Olea europaea subsp. europaea]|uniref:Uncharacterized protein n=1 Tax=Olea europaea subsp. europaea TaxID=158383 RepID=A0A8S0VBT0_OLEEU|nr:Hypothetical predicted protein [Olea europaea subsp. europaea]
MPSRHHHQPYITTTPQPQSPKKSPKSRLYAPPKIPPPRQITARQPKNTTNDKKTTCNHHDLQRSENSSQAQRPFIDQICGWSFDSAPQIRSTASKTALCNGERLAKAMIDLQWRAHRLLELPEREM